MGGAAPVIGLGLQAVGMFGGSGGTQYTPDPKSKYLADIKAIEQARTQAAVQESLLRQQTDVSNQLAIYQQNMALQQIQSEREYYTQQLNNQYQQATYQNQASQLQNQFSNFGQQGNNLVQRLGAQQAQGQAARGLDLQNMVSGMEYGTGQIARQQQGLEAQANQGLYDSNEALQYGRLGINDAQIGMRNTALNSQLQGIDLQQQQFGLEQGAANRGLINQSAQSDIATGQAIGNAELQRQQAYNQLLATFLGNEEQATQQMSRLQAMGLAPGVQGSQLAGDMNLDPRIRQAMQAQQSAYGTQVGQANLANSLTQGQLGVEASALRDRGMLGNQAFNLQRQGVEQERAGLSADRALNNLQRQQLGIQGAGQRYSTNSIMSQLGLAEATDFLQKRLLPDLQTREGKENLSMQRQLAEAGIDINELMRSMQYGVSQNALDTESKALLDNVSSSFDILNSDVDRQRQAINSQAKSTKTSNELALAGALAQLAAGQYGLLSSVGSGLQQGYPSGGGGGGFNIGALAQLFQSAAQSGLLSGGGGSNSSAGGGYNYSLYNYPLPQQQPFQQPRQVSYSSRGGSGGL